MTNKTILREIYRENKSINRNLQRLANIGLIGLLGKEVLRRQKTNDSVGKTLAKGGINVSSSVRDSAYDIGYS